MSSDRSPIQRLDDLLQALAYSGQGPDELDCSRRLTQLRQDLDARLPVVTEGESAALAARLKERGQAVQEGMRRLHQDRREALIQASGASATAFPALHAHTRLIDALYCGAFESALSDLPLVLALRLKDWESELAFSRGQLAQKIEKLQQFQEQLPAILAQGEGDAAGAYYTRLGATMARECGDLRERVAQLELGLPALREFRGEREQVLSGIVVFARGGYGRGELSFESDLDSGYALDARGFKPGIAEALRELVMRVEALLHGAGLETAHQYFEIGEDLSRFTRPETQHTITSILESRTLVGNDAILEDLKQRFRALVPFERFAARKLDEFDALRPLSPDVFHPKSGVGGLRSIQIPLWLVGMTYHAVDFSTAGLLRLAREHRLLSIRDVMRLAQAADLFHDLRNFLGAEEAADPAARGAAVGHGERPFDSAASARYLRARPRWNSLSAFERVRRRLVSDVQRLSRSLLARVLDRTVTHTVGPLLVTVHLSSERITALHAGADQAGLEVFALLENPGILLELFGYIAETGYDLSDTLKDLLADVVARLPLGAPAAAESGHIAAFNHILESPAADRAVATLFETNDPLLPETQSLMGRFIPACEKLLFLPTGDGGVAAHERAIECLARGERRLMWMREAYPEWLPLLQPVHVQGLKWSLLLHDLGGAEDVPEGPGRGAELAAEALAALGNRDQELERLVRLLVQHQQALAAITRSVAYMDQALAEFFDLAERDLVKAILLFLVNLAILETTEPSPSLAADNLLRFFDEAMRLLAGLRSIPSTDRSLELINLYLDGKKLETEGETRLYVLLNRALAQGLSAAVYQPLQRLAAGEWKRLEPEVSKLDSLHRQILLGRGTGPEQERLTTRLLQSLGQHLSSDALAALTADEALSWFFAAFPNRYVLRTSPPALAREIIKFGEFRQSPVLADSIVNAQGTLVGLLISTQGLNRPHTRVAYALGLRRINIVSGKVNRVEFGNGHWGYTYYFEVDSLQPGQEVHPRDLEALILEERSADRSLPRLTLPVSPQSTRIEFTSDDGKGYRVERADGGFVRRRNSYRALHVMRRDEPFLFYRMCRVFDRHEVEWQQALITTTGNLVNDTFYLAPADAARLERQGFADRLVSLIDAQGQPVGEPPL